MPTTILSERGQVVIPAEIRAQLHLEKGDRFEVEVRADGVILKPLPRQPLLHLRGAFKGADRLTEALLSEREAERKHERG